MKKNKGGHISFSQAMDMMSRLDVLLIDVKSREEYEKFHLNNSINIPIEKFNIIAPKMIKDKSKTIIVYCSSGIRSLAAYEMLKDYGFNNVYNIYGGIDI